MTFTAIDFETATAFHPCSVGIVTVQNGVIVDEFVTLIKPPNNQYSPFTIAVHGIRPRDTVNAKSFLEVYPEIKKRLQNKTVVAHNESFDRNVLAKSMALYGLDYETLNISNRWECTLKIYKAKGFKPTKLSDCCQEMNIKLNHHEALSDARACAKLYLLR
ncbi:3'-5' exonuclease [Flavobacterium psychrophilum]|uniref:3'-5' exonuclease n=2 Tax=Flavobacterium psychrophilum TaxID=96345 RepID=A0A076P4J7_FLAPS|nr:3'-5' exonuclease [Flavobacterium psychrophilum]AIG29988.1 DNA polymerase III subunit epsilon [Flavobacterium psychrophilum]AIG32264.1 DNA polymerase III subunit epsilon [Flavobacterium psychrophilum]AIG34422.1 DNA polymerase III subunit epsilon [Flavobacterium psychrophilum]AIG36782.1 DNA polymerase III subunit epsilon [Flavobacterium psychrophilum]AIG39046.1 DNA polymerase III subunit epsilon [Flavobacterium psychrophilum]